MHLTTRGLILREVKYKDSDKILTILTEDEGKLTAAARGARRKGSPLGAPTEILCFSDMTLFGNRGRWTLDEASVTEQFIGLRGDIELLSLAVYFCELLEAMSDEDCYNGNILRLGLNSLFALSHELYSAELIKAAFELRLMCLSGYEPALPACFVCGREDVASPVFNPHSGLLRCAACAGGENGGQGLSQGCLLAMRHIAGAESKRIFSFTLPDGEVKKLSAITETYISAQLDREFDSLSYYKSIKHFAKHFEDPYPQV